MPLFPTLDKYLKVARERVILAREVEKIDLLARREATEENWSRKIAKEADMAEDSSDQDSYVILLMSFMESLLNFFQMFQGCQ